MDQIGHVIKSNNDLATVDVRRTSACGDKCGSCKGGCNVPATRVTIKNSLGAKAGDYVEIAMQTRSVMMSAATAYILPLIMMISGIFLGMFVFKAIGVDNYELFGFFVGIIALIISYFILKSIDKKVKSKNTLRFEMVRIL